MVFISDYNLEHGCSCEEKSCFCHRKVDTAIDVGKCLKQIRLIVPVLKCASYYYYFQVSWVKHGKNMQMKCLYSVEKTKKFKK